MSKGFIVFMGILFLGGSLAVLVLSDSFNSKIVYREDVVTDASALEKEIQDNNQTLSEEVKEEVVAIAHVETPDVMRAVYSTMWSISSKQKRDYLVGLIESTDLNSIVIDVKGSGGELVFDNVGAIEEIVRDLHKKGIYTIARVVVFQDSGLAKTNPEFSLKNKAGNIWRDRRGFAWSDPASVGAWDHIVGISKRAIDLGFDEINYDYIRFPTDGDLDNIVYPAWDGVESKSDVIKRFGAYSKEKLKEYDPDVKLSLDIFGYTFLIGDGLGIGQKLPDMLDNFDYVYPMVYPSHYSTGNFGFANPAQHPYEVVNQTLQKGLESLGERGEEAKPQIRPWIQVFDMGADYTPEMIRAQIQATYDVLGEENTGWLMWSPSNIYDEVLEIKL